MNEKKLSSSKVARLTGNSDLTIRNYRKGRIPRADFILQLCEELHVTPNWFYGYEDSGASTLLDYEPEYVKRHREMEVRLEYLEEQLEDAQNKIVEQRLELKTLREKKAR